MDFSELDLRFWLLMLGLALIAGVFLHGYLRVRRRGRSSLGMKLDKAYISKPGEGEDEDRLPLSDFPSGNARVVPPTLRGETETESAMDEPYEAPESVPDEQFAQTSADEPLAQTSTDEAFEQAREDEAPSANPDDPPALSIPATTPSIPTTTPATTKPEKFFVMHVFALEGAFNGQELLQALAEQEMTFGEMDIFHRMVAGQSVFSLASALEPGAFDMAAMDDFEAPGVSLFMRAHELAEPLQVFDDMLAVAEALALDLAGEVQDETRSVITPQTVEHYRQSIRDYHYKHSV